MMVPKIAVDTQTVQRYTAVMHSIHLLRSGYWPILALTLCLLWPSQPAQAMSPQVLLYQAGTLILPPFSEQRQMISAPEAAKRAEAAYAGKAVKATLMRKDPPYYRVKMLMHNGDFRNVRIPAR